MLESDQMVTSMWASMSSWFTPTYLFCYLNLMIATIYIASNFKNHHPPQPGQLARAPSLLNRVKSINFPFYTSDQHYPFAAPQSHTEQPSQLARTPSLLERVKSINFSFHGHENYNPFVTQPQYEEPTTEVNSFSSHEEQHHSRPSQLVRVPSLLERVRSFNFSHYNQTVVPHPQPDMGSNHHVTAARNKPAEKSPAKVSAKMKKSASAKGVSTAKPAANEDVERRRPATVRERKLKKEPAAETGEEEGCVNAKADDFINKFKQQLKLQRLDSMVRFKEMLGRGT